MEKKGTWDLALVTSDALAGKTQLERCFIKQNYCGYRLTGGSRAAVKWGRREFKITGSKEGGYTAVVAV
jgi:hypothetical protein